MLHFWDGILRARRDIPLEIYLAESSLSIHIMDWKIEYLCLNMMSSFQSYLIAELGYELSSSVYKNYSFLTTMLCQLYKRMRLVWVSEYIYVYVYMCVCVSWYQKTLLTGGLLEIKDTLVSIPSLKISFSRWKLWGPERRKKFVWGHITGRAWFMFI